MHEERDRCLSWPLLDAIHEQVGHNRCPVAVEEFLVVRDLPIGRSATNTPLGEVSEVGLLRRADDQALDQIAAADIVYGVDTDNADLRAGHARIFADMQHGVPAPSA